jgi:oleandomycin transport system ATP-binding protein
LIGLTGQYAAIDEGLSGTNNLVMIGRLLSLPRAQAKARAAELLRRFDLTDAAGRPAKTYSGGMRRRLDLAASLVGNPRVLYLDEPTTGLDPRSRTDLWQTVRGLVADGVTVLLTTQYLDEADQLANEIVVVDHGKVIATGTPDQLKAKTGGRVLEATLADKDQVAVAAALLAQLAHAEPAVDAERAIVTVAVPESTLLAHVVRELDDRGIELAEFSLRKPSLDEVFLTLTSQDELDRPGRRS